MERVIAKSLMVLAPLTGRVSLLMFVIFLFYGSFQIIHLNLPEFIALVWDGVLSILFFIQHSFMTRKSFRARLSKVVPSYCNDAVFTLASSLVLALVVVFWQTSTFVLYEFQGFMYWAARGVFLISVAGMGWGAKALRSFDPFGDSAIRDHMQARIRRVENFSVRGPYRWVRHPLYFFSLLLLWACPHLTLDRFIFNLLWTFWIIIGTILEEKDLVSDFGEDYRRYQKRVPMLIPWKVRLKRFKPLSR